MREQSRIPDGTKLGMFGKGGAGKSTVTVLLAGALRRAGYEVCVLDADSTNTGLHHALGIEQAPEALVDYFGGMVFSGGAVTCPVDDPTRLAGADLALENLPRRFRARSPSGVHLLIAGKMVHMGAGSGCDGPISKIARDLTLRGEAGPLVVLADFKAGFEDSARGIGTGLDRGVVVVDPTVASLELAAGMVAMARHLERGVEPATGHLDNPELIELARRIFRETRLRHLSFVLNKVADENMESYLRGELARHEIEPVATFGRDRLIANAWMRGEAITDVRACEAADRIVAHLERAAEWTPSSGSS